MSGCGSNPLLQVGHGGCPGAAGCSGLILAWVVTVGIPAGKALALSLFRGQHPVPRNPADTL